MIELSALEQRLGYEFADRELLAQALTHRSHGAVHNERLEFLGDAVLNCTIANNGMRFTEGVGCRFTAGSVLMTNCTVAGNPVNVDVNRTTTVAFLVECS